MHTMACSWTNSQHRGKCYTLYDNKNSTVFFFARLHFSVEELLSFIYHQLRCPRPREMLEQMLKTWNFILLYLFLHFHFVYHTNKAPHNKSSHVAVAPLFLRWFVPLVQFSKKKNYEAVPCTNNLLSD